MRLFLLPISTRRTLIYCQRLNVSISEQKGILDKVTSRAAKTWANWEKKESGWQRKVVDYGNRALRGIPYEEWGLKSIPPLSSRRKAEELSGQGTVEVSFPSSLIAESTVSDVLKRLGTEREKLHRSRMIYCLIGMPITIPVALIPVIPNLPFFYLVFRAWSHWRALSGSKHIQFLLENKLVKPKPSPILDELYASGKLKFDAVARLSPEKSLPDLKDTDEEMVLHKSDGTRIAQALDLPELDIELDRAVWQVEKALQSAQDLKDKKREPDSSTTPQKVEAVDEKVRK